jgi:hypothetical protein
MRRIKVGLKDVPLPDQIQTGRLVIASLTNNPNFPNAGPVREQLLAATTELTASFNDAQSARMLFTAKVSAQNEKAAEFKRVMSQVACWVANQSGQDVTKVLSAGFDLKRGNTPLGPLPAPTAFEVWPGSEGTVDLFWARVHGAKSYFIECALAGAEPLDWKTVAHSTTTKVRVKGLVSGRKYLFRVAVVGAAGQSAWSVPIAKVAP